MNAAAAPTGKFSLPYEDVAWSLLEQSVLLLLLLLSRDPVSSFASSQNLWLAFASLLARFASLLAPLASLLARFCR